MVDQRRQGGFTLLEVIIATTLLAVMMILLLGGMRIGEDSWEKGEAVAEQATRMLVVDNFFRSHLGDLKPLLENPNSPQPFGQPPRLTFHGNSKHMEFIATLPPQVRGGMYKFRLHWVVEGGRSDLKLAIRPAMPGGKGGQAEPIEDVLIVENLEALRISYLKKDLQTAKTEWLDTWQENFLPSLIKIEMVPRGESAWPAIVVAPRAEGQ